MVWFEKMFLCVWQLSMPMFIILTIMMGMRKDVISYNPESYFCTSDIIQLGNCSTKLSTNIDLPKVRKIRLRTRMNGYIVTLSITNIRLCVQNTFFVKLL